MIGRRIHTVVLCLLVFLTSTASAQLVISQFRYRGPNGTNDEFIEIENNGLVDHIVAATGTGTGYGIAASDGTVRCSIPDGTVIPVHGHFLCVNSVGYSLATYPAGNGTNATGDATYTTDIPENAGIAIFTSNVPAEMNLATRLDAVGSTAEANVTYKEGTGLPTLVPFSIDYAWVRDTCGKGGSITTFGPCPSNGFVVDSANNAADFYFVDTNGTSAGGGQRLGAGGPRNLSSPIHSGSFLAHTALDPCSVGTAEPNVRYDGTSSPAANSTFGTLTFRRTFTNTTGGPLTRLRFRIIDLATFPAPAGFADMRAINSNFEFVTVDRAPCGSGTSSIPVQGTLLETPPSQPNGGGFNSSLSAATVTLGTPLANGASIDLSFRVGLQQHGQYKFRVIAESLPQSSDALYEVEGCTDGCTGELEVVAIQRLDPSPTTPGTSVDYRVTFNMSSVTGVDAGDFALTTTGSVSGASITNIASADGGLNYIVTVDSGTGTGTLRLDLIDNDTVVSGASPLGGAGAGNGDFTSGEVYALVDAPDVVSITRLDTNPVAEGSTVDFLVTFSEAVTGVDATDFVPDILAGALVGVTVTNVTGSGATRTVTVDLGSGTGTMRLDLIDDDSIIDSESNPLGGAGGTNGDFTAGEAYTVVAAQQLAVIPTLDPRVLVLLGVLLAAVAVMVLRRV